MTNDNELPAVHIGYISKTPVGEIHVAVSIEGVVSLAMGEINRTEFDRAVQARGVGLVVEDNDYSFVAIEQLKQYFSGRRRDFALRIDYRGVTEFRKAVYRATSAIPAGQTTYYGAIASEVGQPRGSQAVGQALANNPIPIIIPCHRVLNKSGGLQGYSAGDGIETKRILLQLEGAMLI